MNVSGTQIGLAVIVLIVAFGLELVTTSPAFLVEWILIVGALFLACGGPQLLNGHGSVGAAGGGIPLGNGARLNMSRRIATTA